MNLSIEKIEVPKYLMRESVDQEHIVALAASIKQNGLINPITVRKDGTGYELIAGHRRILAYAHLGIKEIPARVLRVNADKAESVKYAENKDRAEINPMEEAVYLGQLMEGKGWTQAKLAEQLGLSEVTVSTRIKALAWPEEVQRSVRTGALSWTVARELARVKDGKERARLMGHAIRDGVTVATARRWVTEANSRIENGPPGAANTASGPEAGEGYEGQAGVECSTCGREVDEFEYRPHCKNCMDVITVAINEGVFHRGAEERVEE